MFEKFQNLVEQYHLRQVTLALHVINSFIHVVLTNMPGDAFAITKVLLMPLLCLFFLTSVLDIKKGWPVAWALCGLWLGNICLIWGEESKVLFLMGSGFTVLGIMGYVRMLTGQFETVKPSFILLQMPIVWSCAGFVFLMEDDLGKMFIPITLYMSLIANVCMLGLAQLMSSPKSMGAWCMFIGTVFYIAENGLYTADHYMSDYTFGVNIVHPCFILAQTFIVCGFLIRERELRKNEISDDSNYVQADLSNA